MTKTQPASSSPQSRSSSAAYGAWSSDISSELLTKSTVRLSEPTLDNGNNYWLEQRPEEKGRGVIVCQPADKKLAPFDVTPKSMSVHSKVHEYGGGCYTVDNDTAYFVNGDDQRVYAISIDPTHRSFDQVVVLSPENSEQVSYRYADFFVDSKRQQLIAVCELHRTSIDNNNNNNNNNDHASKHSEPENSIISLRLDGSSTIGFNVLIFGNDFYSNPSISPDDEKLAWLTWDHPNMPWDNSECWIADFNHFGMLHKHRKVAGGVSSQHPSGESVFQPQWSPTGDLLFVSDRNNWWNIYSYNTYNKYTEVLVDMPAEFATPQWVFGMSTYGFLNSYTLLCTYTQQGQWFIATIDLLSHTFTKHASPFTHIEAIACQDDNDTAIFIGANSTQQPEVIHWQTDQWQSIARSSHTELPSDQLSSPEAITFKNSKEDDVHGFFYPPTNAQYTTNINEQEINSTKDKNSTEKPPLIVMSHGGPTGATNASLNVKIQYWTSRGFAVFDINYSGSTGYGREYRRRLYHQWGVLDVDDLCSGATYLASKQLIDKNRMAIRGSSAGGYSVLAALTFTDTFKAGASLYGIGDLSALAEDTHKFESRYCDQLVGAYPKEKPLYDARSPINHIEKLNCPVIFLQGLEDKVVPPNQAEAMVDALYQKNIPVAYVTFDNEGHGFRQAKNIQYAIDVEYAFYANIFALAPTEKLTSVPFVTEPVTSALNAQAKSEKP
jgi:dipeptidyl aminopeptidase/acylaminoacyl peptidase